MQSSPWLMSILSGLICCLVPLATGAGVYAAIHALAKRAPVLRSWREADPENQAQVYRVWELVLLTRQERKAAKDEE